MTKEILLTLSGLQMLGDGEDEPVEVLTVGEYYNRNGKHFIKYEEVVEGFTQTGHNLIKFNRDSLEVIRKGISETHMVFRKNEKNRTYYQTPFGNLLIGVTASEILIREEPDLIDVTVDYELEVNCERIADCTIHLSVRPREEKEAHLLQ